VPDNLTTASGFAPRDTCAVGGGVMAISSRPAGARESARARLGRQALVRHQAEILTGRLFAFLKAQLGESEARRFFDPFSTRRRAKTRGARNPAQDAKILTMYDNAAEGAADKATVPAQLAKRLHEAEHGKYGNSAGAIEKHIRRLLKQREREEEAQAQTERQMLAILNEQERDLQNLLNQSPEKSTDK
jgi:Arc/MetJ-type ribon-helix-helix transcriptional regulator